MIIGNVAERYGRIKPERNGIAERKIRRIQPLGEGGAGCQSNDQAHTQYSSFEVH